MRVALKFVLKSLLPYTKIISTIAYVTVITHVRSYIFVKSFYGQLQPVLIKMVVPGITTSILTIIKLS